MTQHVAVVMGGWSAEREISLVTGNAVAQALVRLGHKVTVIDADHSLAAQLSEAKSDIVFNALHGRWGEDGCVLGIFEIMGIPYTHSGVMASAIAMNKPLAVKLFRAAGIPCALHEIVTVEDLSDNEPLPRPYVVKPPNEGSSIGVSIVREGDDSPEFGAMFDTPQTPVMVEQYIPGRELTCGILGDRALEVVELRPTRGFYDYEAKYQEGIAEHMLPAPVPEQVTVDAKRLALLAHQVLRCRGITRADFRYDDTEQDPGDLYLLEINTQPGMTPLSLVPEMASYEGMGFDELVGWMVEDASCER